MEPILVVGAIACMAFPTITLGIGIWTRGLAASEADKRHVAEDKLAARLLVEKQAELDEARRNIKFLEEQLKAANDRAVNDSKKKDEREKIIQDANNTGTSPDDAALLLLQRAAASNNPAGSNSPGPVAAPIT